MRPSCTPSAVERAYLAARERPVLSPATAAALRAYYAKTGFDAAALAAFEAAFRAAVAQGVRAAAQAIVAPVKTSLPGGRVMPAIFPGVAIPALPMVPVPPEVHAAAALRAELDRRGVTCLYARAVAALEAARVEVLRCAQACDAESAARGLEGSYHAAAAEVLDEAETALLHIVEALPSADTLWDRAADAEACR